MDRRNFLKAGTALAGLSQSSDVFSSSHTDSRSGAAFPPQDSPENSHPVLDAAYREEAYAQAVPGSKDSWAIGNGLVERVVRYTSQNGLFTASWRHKPTGSEFLKHAQTLEPNGPEFTFQADREHLAGAGQEKSDFELVTASVSEAPHEAKLLKVDLKAKSKPIEVSVYYAVYAGHPVVRKWIAITNRGDAPVKISHLAFEAVDLQAGPPSKQILSAYYGVQPREIFYTGRVNDTAVVETNSSTHEGFVVMNEAPGWTKRIDMTGWGNGVRVMYDTDLFPFESSLHPNSTLTSAKCGVAFFVEGQHRLDPRWSMPTYTSEILMRNGGSYEPPWIYNTWEPFYRNINSSTVEAIAGIAGKMGMDVLTIDDGWQEEYGENKVDSGRFPQGLDALRANIEQQGMRLGLWTPLAAISSGSRAYREHPDWVCRDSEDQPKSTGTAAGTRVVMCMDSPYRDAAAERLIDLIRVFHLRYAKIDLTTIFNAYGEESPGCYAKGHYHQDWSQSLAGIYKGIEYVMQRIYEKHPEVLLDLTFELWGQKHIIDYGLLNAGDLDWMSNVNDASPQSAGPRQARTLLYHRSMAIPVETMLIGNLRADTPTIEERFATAIGSGPLLLGDLTKLSAEDVRWYGEKIRWFKALRHDVPISQGFFPLGSWRQPAADAWDGFARLSHQGEGVIVLFKNDTDLTRVNVNIPAHPPGKFLIKSVSTGEALGTFSSSAIRRGLPLPLPRQYKVQILEVRIT